MRMISFVVPCFNGEEFLGKCINSIINQECSNFEIIVVNDGSTDRSIDIIREFEKKYDFIKVINQDNLGLSNSRNAGLFMAKGDYVHFVDVDDWLEPGILKNFEENEIFKKDIIIYAITINYAKENIKIPVFVKDYNEGMSVSDKVYHLMINELFNYAWNKIYNRQFLIDNNLFFVQNAVPSEDFEFNCRSFARAKDIKIENIVLYNYMKHGDSLVSKYQTNLENSLNIKHHSLEYIISKLSLYEFNNFNCFVNKMTMYELEDFVINLFRKGCNLKFREKVKKVKENIYETDLYKKIIKCKDVNLYNKIFIFSVKSKSPRFICWLYCLLTFMKDKFSSLYLVFRRKFILKEGE